MRRSFTDPYYYPGTTVLRNKPGLRDKDALGLFEYEQSELRGEELRERPITGKFDLGHLQAIHAYLFQDVYPWAGKIRTVNISKGNSSFAFHEYIESEAKRLSQSLVKENRLQGMEKPRFVERLAYYHSEWNALHRVSRRQRPCVARIRQPTRARHGL